MENHTNNTPSRQQPRREVGDDFGIKKDGEPGGGGLSVATTPPSRDPIGSLMPWVAGEERELRNRLLHFRQRARTRARESHDEIAYTQWMLARDLADMWATEPARKSHLQDVLRVVAYIALTADAIERWSSPA